MVTRRAFLVAIAAAAAVPFAPVLPAAAAPTIYPELVGPGALVDRELGISMRFIRSFDVLRGNVLPQRLDVLYFHSFDRDHWCRVNTDMN